MGRYERICFSKADLGIGFYVLPLGDPGGRDRLDGVIGVEPLLFFIKGDFVG